MENNILIKTFKTYAHPYAYDRHTNAVVMLSDDEYNELSQIEQGRLDAEESTTLKKYQSYGMFQPNKVEKIEHPSSKIVKQYINTRMRQLTLQVTQQCNLRCEYCIYSGKYEKSRTHSSARMSFETAKKAIDFFLERNRELPMVVIGFYGGEPLLEFELIKKCIDYANSCVEGKKLRFNMTSNGTLLTDEIADYLVENDFSLAISLDGSKEEHDASRKFVSGKGSFDTIIANIKRLKERYPTFVENNVRILTTVNPYMDLSCTLEYFSVSDVFNDRQIVFNSMNENNFTGEIHYDNSYFQIRNFEHIKMLFSLVGKLDVKHVSTLATGLKGSIEQKINNLRNRSEIPSTMHHNGPCMPGV